MYYNTCIFSRVSEFSTAFGRSKTHHNLVQHVSVSHVTSA